jgi:hypothetical protein
LGDSSYYTKESKITRAYKKYMRDLAKALNNDLTVKESEITGIFEFEKEIAKVKFSYFICVAYFFLHSIIGHQVNKMLEVMKRSMHHSVV